MADLALMRIGLNILARPYRGEETRSQRSLLVRLRKEVQALPPRPAVATAQKSVGNGTRASESILDEDLLCSRDLAGRLH